MQRKILIISQLWYPDTFGGSERVAYEQARRLVERGNEVTVLVHRDRKELPAEGEMDGIRVIRYGRLGLRKLVGRSMIDLLDVPHALSTLLRSWTPDVVLLHHPFPAAGYFRSKYAKFFYTFYLFHASVYRELQLDRKHGGIARSFFGKIIGVVATPLILLVVRIVEGRALNRTHRIGVLSQFSKKILDDTYPKASHKVVELPGGVDLETFQPRPSARALRLHLGVPEDADVVLTVRRLVPRMGLSLLIDAIARAREEQPSLICVIGGTGPEEKKLKAEVRKRKMEYAVRFVGKIPANQLADYYGAADVYALPTIAYEGLGLTTLEAMASGLPVVAMPVGATPEVLTPVTPDLLAAAVTPQAFAETLVRYLKKTPEERRAVSQSVRTYVEQHYSWDRSVDALETQFDNLLAG